MSDIRRLLEIMARLRDPDTGCPWDLEQDFKTISPYTIEEAYEVDEAVASGDPAAIQDELGDLLFQVVFQARIAEEKGLFDWSGVVDAISDKLVRRHPHIFANAEMPESSAAHLVSWEEMKATERAASGKDGQGEADPFEGVPRNLPALARSAKIVRRLTRLDPAALKALGAETVAPSPDAMRQSTEKALAAFEEEGTSSGREMNSKQIGEGIRHWVRLARAQGIDPEQALREVDDVLVERVREASPAAAVHPESGA